MLDLAEKIIDLTGSSSKLRFMALPQDDPLQRKPCIELAKRELDWEPHVGIDDGLTKTIRYFENILNYDKQVFERA